VKRGTLGCALRQAERFLDRADARALLRHALRCDSAYLIAHGGDALADEDRRCYEAVVARRAAGEPVAYLNGEREFFGRVFKVSSAVLIPRPETELLVELALERIDAAADARVADLGTGSGCIAITLALERPRASVLAVESARDALAIARRNAAALSVSNVEFLESDWFSAMGDRQFDVIVSNPPYVARSDPHLAEGDLRFEPSHALVSGDDGLDSIRAVVETAPAHLGESAWLLLEHAYDQAAAVRRLLESKGYADVFSARDLAGIERVSGGRVAPLGRGR
jgi:release factor glutamine methyltransferase